LQSDLRKEMAELGWAEGKNLSVDWRFANGDAARLAPLAAELVRSGVDALLTRGTPATQALQRATQVIPIVTGVGDPVGAGFAQSYAEPGGNITGLSYAVVETQRKQLELLREALPRLSRLVIVFPANRLAFVPQMTGAIEAHARTLGIATRTRPVATPDDLPAALRPEPGAGAAAAYVVSFGAGIDPKLIAEAALRQRLPTFFEQSFYVDAGGLMSFSLYWDNQTRSTAVQIDKLFRGLKPAQIPFELPTRSELVINRATAKALGLTLPQALLLRADRVVE
jgi:putative ABC transport system substrate-binding protein